MSDAPYMAVGRETRDYVLSIRRRKTRRFITADVRLSAATLALLPQPNGHKIARLYVGEFLAAWAEWHSGHAPGPLELLRANPELGVIVRRLWVGY